MNGFFKNGNRREIHQTLIARNCIIKRQIRYFNRQFNYVDSLGDALRDHPVSKRQKLMFFSKLKVKKKEDWTH